MGFFNKNLGIFNILTNMHLIKIDVKNFLMFGIVSKNLNNYFKFQVLNKDLRVESGFLVEIQRKITRIKEINLKCNHIF